MYVTVVEDMSCLFLSLPAEIRLSIYHYLLLDPPRASLDPNYHKRGFRAALEACVQVMTEEIGGTMDQHHQHASVGHYNEAQRDVYNHHHNNPGVTGEWSVMYDYLVVDESGTPLSPTLGTDEDGFLGNLGVQEKQHVTERRRNLNDEPKTHRYPAILRTNRQIYDEASTLLYSTLVIEVRPGDIMVSNCCSWKGIVQLSDHIRHFSPSQQLGVKTSIKSLSRNPFKNLESRESKFDGTMEPHVFARFKKVSFIVDLNFVDKGEADVPFWLTFFVDDEFHTSREDENIFIARLKGESSNRRPVSDIIQQFVDTLVKSPYISHFDITLNVKVEADFDIDSESDDDDDDGNGEQHLVFSRQQDENEEKKMNVANERATELVLEAGVLDPLKRLSNVKHLRIAFASSVLKPKVLGIVQDMRKRVEGNYMARQGPAWKFRLRDPSLDG